MSLLSFLVLSPLLGIIVLAFVPKTQEKLIRIIGILATIPALFVTFFLFLQYQSGAELSKWNESVDWIALKSTDQFGGLFSIGYELNLDGLALVLLLLTSIVGTLSAVASIYIKKEWKGYFMLFLLLEAGMLGVFSAGNMILFFLFFEMTLIPTFFLIGKWGYEEKEDAAWKFLIYNGLGSAILLIVIIALFAKTGTTNIELLTQMMAAGASPIGPISDSLQLGLFIALLIAFGFKVPIFPLHRWMVKVHVQAPTPTVMIHSGILLKIGAYGLIRFGLGMFPEQFEKLAALIAILGIINLLYGAFLAFRQDDFKMVLAYSSISHMGIVLMGLAAVNEAGVQGAIFQVVSHGLISALLFFLVGVYYERTQTTMIPKLGGMAKAMPITAGFLLAAGMASLGLPGMSGFVSEFMALLGLFKEMPVIAAFSSIGIIMTAVYTLKKVLGITYGNANRDWAGVSDMQTLEYVPTIVLTALVVLIGVYPNILSEPLQATIETMLRIGG